MREPAWMVKYQAREALKNGRPEDAHRLYDGLVSSGAGRVWALRGDVIRGYVERAEKALRNDDVESDWKDMLRCADEVLNVAPRHREAQQARNRAWQVLQPEAIRPTPSLEDTVSLSRAPAVQIEDALQPPVKRFFLWIDGVGAYLVCLGNRISIGQATGVLPVAVTLVATVSG